MFLTNLNRSRHDYSELGSGFGGLEKKDIKVKIASENKMREAN